MDFPSQIGWKYDGGDIPSQKIKTEKLYVHFDLNGGNNVLSHYHGKMPHRTKVMEKVYDYLKE